ncbi:hypothetical protein BSKO_12298 [Bryopsis sp. KO-2023]|nr:hypothetical protein BSKO_12298 [Bryopsis sp. KO-2023]
MQFLKNRKQFKSAENYNELLRLRPGPPSSHGRVKSPKNENKSASNFDPPVGGKLTGFQARGGSPRLRSRSSERTKSPLLHQSAVKSEVVEDKKEKIPVAKTAASTAGYTSHLEHFSANEGDVIFNEGEVGDKFYVIISGRVLVSMKDTKEDEADEVKKADSKKDLDIAYLNGGDSFGELALMGNASKRRATVTCDQNCEFMVLLRTHYETILGEHTNNELVAKIEFLRQVPRFRDIPLEKTKHLARLMTTKDLAPNTVLFRQDAFLEEMYFVVHGLLKTIRAVKYKVPPPSHPKLPGPPEVMPEITDPPKPDKAARKARILQLILAKYTPAAYARRKKKESVYDVTMKALRAAIEQQEKALTPRDVKHFNQHHALQKDRWLNLEEIISPASVITTTTTRIYVLSKWDILKCLVRVEIASILDTSLHKHIDEEKLKRAYMRSQNWKTKQKALIRDFRSANLARQSNDPIYIWTGPYRLMRKYSGEFTGGVWK